MNKAERFLQRCKLTCLGGSERGTCLCRGPADCEERESPLFSEYRKKAEARLHCHLINDLKTLPKQTEVMMIDCKTCHGSGRVTAESRLFDGVVGTRSCHVCNGTGKLDVLELVEVKEHYVVGPDPDECTTTGFSAIFRGPKRATREEAEKDEAALVSRQV